MEESIKKICKDSKARTEDHQALVKQLIDIYSKSNFESFCEKFIISLESTLTDEEGNENTVEFITTFLSSIKSEIYGLTGDKDTENVALHIEILQFLLKNHESENATVRHKVCLLISRIFDTIHEQLQLDNPFNIKIKKAMLHHLMDDIPSIRVQAVLTLYHFQDSSKRDCEIICAFALFLSIDPNPEVRKAILSHISVKPETLPEILERRSDKQDTVRKQVYHIISDHVNMRILSVTQRISVIDEGLKDRSPTVRHVVKKNLLPAWLKAVDGNIVEFLRFLDVETWADSAECAVNSLFENSPVSSLLKNFNILNEKKLIPYEELTAESVLYWKCLAKYLRSEKADNSDHPMDEILPHLSSFCEYVTKYFEITTSVDNSDAHEGVGGRAKDFICQHLISMTTLFDLADEVGHNHLCSLVRNLFLSPSVNEKCIKVFSIVFSHLYSPSVRLNKLSEILSEIRHHPDAAKTLSLEKEDSDCQNTAKYSEEDLKVKMKLEISEDVETSRCLLILSEFLSNTEVLEFDAALRSLHDSLILPSLQSKDMKLRKYAVRSLIHCGLLSRALAKQHLSRLSQIVKFDEQETIQTEALHGLFEIWLLYGLEEFYPDGDLSTEDGDKETPYFTIMHTFFNNILHSNDGMLRTVAVEGLCKLLLASQIKSFKLLSLLLLLWFSPSTENNTVLRELLEAFFTLYSKMGIFNQEALAAALVPSLHDITSADVHSPISKINIDSLVKFLITITCPAVSWNDAKMASNAHDSLAQILCREILTNPDKPYTETLVRYLNRLNVTRTDHQRLQELSQIVQKIVEKVKEQDTKTLVEKFYQTIQDYLQPDKPKKRFIVGKKEFTNPSCSAEIIIEAVRKTSEISRPLKRRRVVEETKENNTKDITNVMDIVKVESETELEMKNSFKRNIKAKDKANFSVKFKPLERKKRGRGRRHSLLLSKSKAKSPGVLGKNNTREQLAMLLQYLNKEKIQLPHMDINLKDTPWLRGLERKRKQWHTSPSNQSKKRKISKDTSQLSVVEAVDMWKNRLNSMKIVSLFASVGSRTNNWSTRLGRRRKLSNRPVMGKNNKNCEDKNGITELSDMPVRNINNGETPFSGASKVETKGRRRWSSTGNDTHSKPSTVSSLRPRSTTIDSMSYSPSTVPLLKLLSKSKDGAVRSPECFSSLAKKAMEGSRRESSYSSSINRVRRERRSSCYTQFTEEAELPKHPITRRRYSVTVMYPNVLVEFTDENL